MKICWIAPNGGNFTLKELKGTGGWISSLESALLEADKNIEIGIIFPYNNNIGPKKIGRVTYYPVFVKNKGKVYNQIRRWVKSSCSKEYTFTKLINKCVNDYKPDIVHIWGTEHEHINILKYLQYPNVVHIQGLASAYKKVYFPFNVGFSDIKKLDGFKGKIFKVGNFYSYLEFCKKAKDEEENALYVNNWIGRTEWDKASAHCLNPKANYYYCGELMRTDFDNQGWTYHYDKVLHIQTAISNSWYKGIDVILQTAKLMRNMGESFVWNVYGISESSRIVRFFSDLYGIDPKSVNVHFLGNVDGSTIKEGLLSSDVYVHPSYIENSSNAIAEAMLLGMPVVAQYVGGNPSMIKEGAGILVQCNDINLMANAITSFKEESKAVSCGKKAREVAQERHNKDKVVRDLLNIYNQIIQNHR